MPKPSKRKETVARVMHEFKQGELASATGKKATNLKQAIAIGLHEAGAAKARAHDEGGDSKADLYAEARRRNVPGRSYMSKDELRRAVRG